MSGWEPKKLNARHREILRRIFEGATYNKIAAEMGMSYQAVMMIATSKLGEEHLAKLQAQADSNMAKPLESGSRDTLEGLGGLMRKVRSELLQEKNLSDFNTLAKILGKDRDSDKDRD